MQYIWLYVVVHIISGLYFAEHAFNYFREMCPPFHPPRLFTHTMGIIGGPTTAIANLWTFGKL